MEPTTTRSPLEVHQSLLTLASQAVLQVASNPRPADYLLPDATPTPQIQSGGSSK